MALLLSELWLVANATGQQLVVLKAVCLGKGYRMMYLQAPFSIPQVEQVHSEQHPSDFAWVLSETGVADWWWIHAIFVTDQGTWGLSLNVRN